MYTTIDTTFHEGILEILPDPVLWVTPVYSVIGNIDDFEVQFSNKKADDALAHFKGSLMGLRIKRDGIPSVDLCTTNFQHLLKVFETGEGEEFTLYLKKTGSSLEALAKKYKEGVLSIIRDPIWQREAEKKEEKANQVLESIVQNSYNGILMYESMRDESNKIVDFKIKYHNQQCNELSGYSDKERQELTFRQILQGIGAESFFDRYIEVVETGKRTQREQYVERSGKWILSSIVKLYDGFLAMLTDITEHKILQELLQQQSAITKGILDASLNGIYSLIAVRDKSGVIVDFNYLFANKVIAEFLDSNPEQLAGKSMLTLIPENKENGFFNLFCEVLQNGAPFRDQVYFVTARSNKWFEYSIVKMNEESLVVTLQDISEQKYATLKIEEQKAMLDNILKFSSSGISVSEVIRNKEGKVIDARTVLANDAAIINSGIPKELYLTKTATEIDPQILTSSYYKGVLNTLETGEPFNTRYFLQPTSKWLEVSVSRMDHDHIITIFTDVTEVRKNELQLEKLVEELKRSNANLEEFTYAASHDLKEPIRKIGTFTNQLKSSLQPKLSEREAYLFDRIENSTIRMTQLVDDLLEYSHVTINPSATERIDLNDKIRKVLDDLELVIREKSAIVIVGKLPVIVGNRRQIQQLFQNLISNGLKYSKSDVPPEITITSEVVPASKVEECAHQSLLYNYYHKIVIKDNGIGFEQQYADKIFQVFQRLHGKAEYQGTGVGLAIVKKVVQNNNGFITVQSEPGAGATFIVYFPQEEALL